MEARLDGKKGKFKKVMIFQCTQSYNVHCYVSIVSGDGVADVTHTSQIINKDHTCENLSL